MFWLIDIRLIVKAVSTQLYIGHNINNNRRLHINDDKSKWSNVENKNNVFITWTFYIDACNTQIK